MLPISRVPFRPVLRPLAQLLAGLGLACSAVAMQPASSPGVARVAPADTTDRIIVKYRNAANAVQMDSASLSRAQVVGNRVGARLSHLRSRGSGDHVFKLDRKMNVADVQALAASIAAGDPDVEYAEPDRIMRIQVVSTPNDTSYSQQWDFFEAVGGINVPAAWSKSTGAGVVVAVLDTGHRPHVDLAANLVPGYDFISDTFIGNDGDGRDADASDPGDWTLVNECGGIHDPSDSSWHGTHVAGTIAAVTNNGMGVAGVAYGAKVQSVRVLGKCGGYTSDIADGIKWASGGTVSGVSANPTPARVINMSLGGAGSCGTTTQNAINDARSRGTVVVVAAGNSNLDAGSVSPANCAGVVTVAAVGRAGSRAAYSNFGTVVDVAAPGGDQPTDVGILSTLNAGSTVPAGDTYVYYQGTSMATPHVAGVAALMLSANPALTPDDVEARLKSTARAFPGSCALCGTGIVDADAAVVASIEGVTTMTEVETNNTMATAQTISVIPARVTGAISSSIDTDYYKITVGVGKTVIATLTPNASANFDLYAYNAAGKNTVVSRNGTGLADTVRIANKTASDITYYVRVVRWGGTGAYTLELAQQASAQ